MFQCVPCSHGSILMFPTQAKRIPYDINTEYDLCQTFSHLSLTKHSAKEEHIAICNSCISISKCHNAPILTTIPDILTNVLIFY